MPTTDPALTVLASGWGALSLLHGRIEAHIERALQSGHDLSVREYALLDVLSRQHDGPGAPPLTTHPLSPAPCPDPRRGPGQGVEPAGSGRGLRGVHFPRPRRPAREEGRTGFARESEKTNPYASPSGRQQGVGGILCRYGVREEAGRAGTKK
ncbi:MarR family transcriptional regulator [Streptomyces laurentii]|uniref:MarR family transcriptional regulator n=1 Tax=Streptomyces laurentii TaxID=39478 RepID=UPI0036A07006